MTYHEHYFRFVGGGKCPICLQPVKPEKDGSPHSHRLDVSGEYLGKREREEGE